MRFFGLIPRYFRQIEKKDQLTKMSISNLLLERISPSKIQFDGQVDVMV
jgi:hypothetical protein